MKSLILDIHKQLKENKITPAELVVKAKNTADKFSFTNSIITPIFSADGYKFDENNLLSCIPYSLKDNVTTEGIKTTGGSKFLSNYIPPFNATVYQILKDNGAILLSKDNLDEFGLGGTGTFSAYGIVHNPLDTNKITGGSSSGSAANVASGVSTFAIGSDTGDSVRRPASLCGIVGYKPTYGAISRYGVLPYCPSLDHVGILAKYVADATIVASALIKPDSKDFTSTNLIKDVKLENLKEQKHIKFVVMKNLLDLLGKEKVNKFNELLEQLKEAGHEIVYVDYDINLLKALPFCYKVISYVEGYSCYSSFQGLTFGNNVAADSDDYDTTVNKNRTVGIGKEVKRRFILGAYLSTKENYDANMLAARKYRRLILDAELAMLKQGDVILMPTTSTVALDINKPYSGNMYDD